LIVTCDKYISLKNFGLQVDEGLQRWRRISICNPYLETQGQSTQALSIRLRRADLDLRRGVVWYLKRRRSVPGKEQLPRNVSGALEARSPLSPLWLIILPVSVGVAF